EGEMTASEAPEFQCAYSLVMIPSGALNESLKRTPEGGGEPETVKLSALEVPPPGPGLKTVTESVPAAAMSPEAMVAVSLDELTKVVVRGEPFHWTAAPLTKLEPSTVRVKSGPPAAAEAGERLEIEGTGLDEGLLIVKVTE